jgi:hypothetical protein
VGGCRYADRPDRCGLIAMFPPTEKFATTLA